FVRHPRSAHLAGEDESMDGITFLKPRRTDEAELTKTAAGDVLDAAIGLVRNQHGNAELLGDALESRPEIGDTAKDADMPLLDRTRFPHGDAAGTDADADG